MDSELSDFVGEPLLTVRVYDEDDDIDVKYEPFDSERESNDVPAPKTISSTVRSTVYGPLKTVELKKPTHPFLRQVGGYVNGKKTLQVVLTPEMQEQNRLEDMKGKTRNSQGARYVEETIASKPSTSKPVKSHPDSNRSDQSKREVINPRTRRPYRENSESESDGRSSDEIQTDVVTLGEKVDCSNSHEINLTEHVAHAQLEFQDITPTGNNFSELSKSTVGGEAATMSKPAKTGDIAGKFQKLTHTGDKPSITTRNVEKPARPRSGGKRTPATMTKPKTLETLESSESDSVANTDSDSDSGSDHETFTCKKCGKTFPTKLKLQRHTYGVHTAEKRYKCSECGKGFTVQASMETHRRIHTGEKSFTCHQCGKSFKDKRTWRNHMATHSKSRPFVCDICQKNFKMENQLTEHKRNHAEKKPFECQVCKKTFLLKRRLAMHQKTHDAVKEFQCDMCERSFVRSDQLAYHKLSHAAEKPQM